MDLVRVPASTCETLTIVVPRTGGFLTRTPGHPHRGKTTRETPRCMSERERDKERERGKEKGGEAIERGGDGGRETEREEGDRAGE